MEDSLKDVFVNAINAARKEVEVSPILCCSFEQTMDFVAVNSIVLEDMPFVMEELEGLGEEALAGLSSRFAQNLLSNAKLQNLITSRDFTHVDSQFVMAESKDQAVLKISLFSRFLDIEPPGQVIDGDLVVQGSTVWLGDGLSERGPVLCVVEFARDEEEVFREVLVVRPWEMMFDIESPESASAGGKEGGGEGAVVHGFAIPISLSPELKRQRGSVRVSIFVDEVQNIPYNEEVDDFKQSAENYVCAIEVHTQSIDSSSASRQGSPRANRSAVGGDMVDGHGLPLLDGGSFADEDGFAVEENALGVGGALEGGDMSSSVDLDGSRGGKPTLAKASLSGHHLKHGDRVEFVNDIKIALDFDDLQAFVSEGYDSNAVQLSGAGPMYETEHLWKFHVVSSHKEAIYGEPNCYGLEDIMWIRCLKSMGALPVIPNYEVIDSDLLSTQDDFSIFIAVRMGKNPRFKSVSVVSCPIEMEDELKPFLSGRRSVFKQAPNEICKALKGICGLALEFLEEFGGNIVEHVIANDAVKDITSDSSTNNNNSNNSSSNDGSGKMGRRSSSQNFRKSNETAASSGGGGGGGDPVPEECRGGNNGGEENEQGGQEEECRSEHSETSEGDPIPTEDEMQKRLNDLKVQLSDLQDTNLELQRKSALLIAREKLNSGQISIAKSPEAIALQAVIDAEQNPELMQDKLKQYMEYLVLITEGNRKLKRQVGEFDQLAADLQTRLDDKEYKATEVTESFRKFKKEILARSVNSRTGLPLAVRMVEQIVETEAKRDEDLEKVRLRNISLRTGLKKLDRALRAKEQLAEGLHMIDFEQLKIENTTLSEKIEERTDELNKLKRRRTTTLQILTHIREKLRHTNKGNDKLKADLTSLEASITSLRGEVTNNKHSRDVVKHEVKNLKRAQGFTTNDLLLVDFEQMKSDMYEVRATVREYQDRYNILTTQVEKGNRTLLALGGNYSPTSSLSPVSSPKKSPMKSTSSLFN